MARSARDEWLRSAAAGCAGTSVGATVRGHGARETAGASATTAVLLLRDGGRCGRRLRCGCCRDRSRVGATVLRRQGAARERRTEQLALGKVLREKTKSVSEVSQPTEIDVYALFGPVPLNILHNVFNISYIIMPFLVAVDRARVKSTEAP